MFLAGRQSEVMSMLRTDMEAHAERLEFEQAAKIRNRLQSLERVVEKQQVFFQNQKVSQDIIAEAHTNRFYRCMSDASARRKIDFGRNCLPSAC